MKRDCEWSDRDTAGRNGIFPRSCQSGLRERGPPPLSAHSPIRPHCRFKDQYIFSLSTLHNRFTARKPPFVRHSHLIRHSSTNDAYLRAATLPFARRLVRAMFYRHFFPPSSIFIIVYLLLIAVVLPSECLQANGDPEGTIDWDELREKRDGGFVSGPVAAAIVSGMIGMTAKAVADVTTFVPHPSTGGCSWFGTAPLCNMICPSEYDFIRKHNGRCSNSWFAGVCTPDHSFGEPCSTIFGSTFVKRFCCK